MFASNTIPLSQRLSELKESDLIALGLTTSASLLQAQFFFGLASEALGRKVGHNEFSEQSEAGGPRFIDIRIGRWFSVELHERWSKLRSELSPHDFEHIRRKLRNNYDFVNKTSLLLDAMGYDTEYDQTLVLLSVHMLLFIIADILKIATMLTYHAMSSTKLLIQRMVRNGWCEKRLNIFASVRTGYPCLYYLASMTPPQAQNHIDCSPQSCRLSTVFLPPLHRAAECLCPGLQPPQAEVNSILAADGIPLIRVSSSSTGDITLEVVPYQRGTRFTAISHVWTDRQFGSSQNCLPRCQVKYLYSLLIKLPRNDLWEWQNWWPWRSVPPGEIDPPVCSSGLLWLDTFCIPQGSTHVDLKDKAIQSMNFVYAVATQTLVLDADLQRLDVGRRPSSLFHGGAFTFYAPEHDKLLDSVAHIFASTWMGRAWYVDRDNSMRPN